MSEGFRDLCALVGMIGGLSGIVTSVFNWIDRRERKDREAAEESEEALRLAWCERMAATLERAPGGTATEIDPEDLPRAKWGAEQGYFALVSADPKYPLIARRG